jgi:hypothetical protein
MGDLVTGPGEIAPILVRTFPGVGREMNRAAVQGLVRKEAATPDPGPVEHHRDVPVDPIRRTVKSGSVCG